MEIAGFLGESGHWALVVLGVGLLIFIHELGHFLVAKWTGVRVLVFSLGFGPEVAGFTRGPTRYRLSAVPLGGYVKMSGETEQPGGGYAPDDYPAKPVGTRALIIVAGVVMNGILGFALYAAALALGIREEPPVAGVVVHGEPAWEAGLRPGDRILSIDGRPADLFTDLLYATMGGRRLELEVERAGRRFSIAVTPETGLDRPTPAIGVRPPLSRAMVVPERGSAETAGLRTGDELIAVDGVPCTLAELFYDPLVQVAILPLEGPVRVTVRRDGAETGVSLAPAQTRPGIGISPLMETVDAVRPGGPAEGAGWTVGDRPLSVAGRAVRGWHSFVREAFRAPAPGASVRVVREGGEASLALPDAPLGRLDLLRDLRFAESPSPAAVEVHAGGPAARDGRTTSSPAAAAGIPTGARITEVGGAKVARFRDIRERIAAAKGAPVEVAWVSDSGRGRATVTPVPLPLHYGLGVETERVTYRLSSPGAALAEAWARCLKTTGQITTVVSGIFRGSVDSGELGGPILIGQVVHRSSREGAGDFLGVLAMLSINLMFLNVLPIPLLDGGQLALLGLEAVTRRPPSEAVVGIAQMVGLALILGLVVLVTYNDVARLLGS